MSDLFRWKKPNKRLPARIAHEAFKKIHMGEEISDEELQALFESFYVQPISKKGIKQKDKLQAEELYELKTGLKKSEFHQFVIPSVELEMLAYFR